MSQLDLFGAPPPLKRTEALTLLAPYLGRDLRELADALGVTSPEIPPRSSGWAGHTVEWLLGQSPNNHQSADFGEWELKVTTVEPHPRQKRWRPRGVIALTHFQPSDLLDVPFEESHLYAKIKHLLIACHEPSDSVGYGARLVKLCPYDLRGEVRAEVEREYQALQWALRSHGLMGLREVTTQRLGVQAEQRGWRFLARRRWVDEMISTEMLRQTDR